MLRVFPSRYTVKGTFDLLPRIVGNSLKGVTLEGFGFQQ
jgi:hypothetical protein